jgi:rhizosphere induced protein
LPADPSSDRGCQAGLSYDGDFQLTPAMGKPTGDTLSIDDDPTVPLPSRQPSSVAITLAGSPVCATNAGPDLRQVFTLHPTYYIDASEYVRGRIVDGSSVTGFQRLDFGDGTALTATLQQDVTWTIGPSRP